MGVILVRKRVIEFMEIFCNITGHTGIAHTQPDVLCSSDGDVMNECQGEWNEPKGKDKNPLLCDLLFNVV